MTDVLRLQVSFHGPFHVLTGSSADGVDATVDTEHPLPESAVKGLMRASALRLGVQEALVGEVFGRTGRDAGARVGIGSPWSWRCGVADELHLRTRASVPIDDASGAAKSGLIRFAEEIWAESLDVFVERMGWIGADRVEEHLDVLRVAARGVTALGHDRNRGYGWVSITEPGKEEAAECRRLAGWLIEQIGGSR